MISKEQILSAIETLPDDATIEEAIERLYVLYKIEKGIQQADAGLKVNQEEVRRRMQRWLE
jgi:hypothetical protein